MLPLSHRQCGNMSVLSGVMVFILSLSLLERTNMLERVCFPSSFSSLHHLSSWEAMKAFFFARWLPSVSFYKVGFLLAVEPGGSDFWGWYRHWSRRIHEKHKSKDRGYFFSRYMMNYLLTIWNIVCKKKKEKKKKGRFIFFKNVTTWFSDVVILWWGFSTRVSQITPASCCGSCSYQDRK